ncbi:energy-coupling factor ABC transporter ATP-binding protein [Subtercola boreus]|uniref:Energy-coupling factor ABC transporter ATP-binding protein n=1 Tax=Subtercola boreus TaxID=120213 RepID=A0A3E0W8M1_9MICO|nr:energy-coupling factor ABC transporter ATP-binding protein [Subtercola boreus]RFA18153.1 energy-coupling factor ABC transporter ATP-binding protein [Subtercola boreus]RFA18535.1 energy-coupling factor ABC transporter ATP-binding protein [Subtercola boreus]RFA25063.1 energy-coupling factor ABC transporter ATP-binding protein [Subtercola boreus]
MTASLVFDDVSVRLGDRLALDSVSLVLDRQRTAVIGANGSGKSTFARVLGGLVAPSGGSVSVFGVDPVRQASAVRRLVGFVFSNPDAQIIMPTVAEDAAFSLRSERLPRAESAERVRLALAEFGLTELADRAAHDLSGGQKQLLALVGAVIRRPQLLIADEPTAFLDARNSRLIADHLLAPTDRSLVLVTHDLDLAQRCDVAVLFEDGRMIGHGDPADIVARYESSLSC